MHSRMHGAASAEIVPQHTHMYWPNFKGAMQMVMR